MTRSGRHAGLAIGALATAVLVAIALAGGGFAGDALGIATAAVWVAIVVLVLSGVVSSRRPSAGLVAGAACLLALLALTALSMGWTTGRETAFEEAVRLSGYLGLFLLVGLLIRREWIGAVLTGLAAAGVLVAFVALGSRLLGIGSGDADLVAVLPTASGRLSFPIGYWNALGALMALSIPPLCWRAASVSSMRLSGVALAGFAPLSLAGYLTSSRGALLAMGIGLAVTVACSPDRRRFAAAAVIGLASAVPAVAVASAAEGLVTTPADGSPGGPELATLAALIAGMAFAALLGGRLVGPLSRSRPFSIRVSVRAVIAIAVAIAAVVVVAAGPSGLIGDLRDGTDEATVSDESARGIVSASGSGRTQFWEAALDAFAEEPVRGIGAGAFPDYWTENGSLDTAARNAHSQPLEVLAELGLAGFVVFACLIAVILACAVDRVRRARPEEGAAAAMGLIAASMLSFAIDWTWEVPAVVAPVLIVAAMSCATAVRSRFVVGVPRPPARVVALASLVVAVPAIWAASVLALTTAELDASDEAFAEGRLNEAAAAARAAAAVQPWATEPWMKLALVERAAGNTDASLAAVAEVIRRNGSDFDAWALAASLRTERGENRAAIGYGLRANDLSTAD